MMWGPGGQRGPQDWQHLYPEDRAGGLSNQEVSSWHPGSFEIFEPGRVRHSSEPDTFQPRAVSVPIFFDRPCVSQG